MCSWDLDELVRNDVLARGVHSVAREAADVAAALATLNQAGLEESSSHFARGWTPWNRRSRTRRSRR